MTISEPPDLWCESIHAARDQDGRDLCRWLKKDPIFLRWESPNSVSADRKNHACCDIRGRKMVELGRYLFMINSYRHISRSLFVLTAGFAQNDDCNALAQVMSLVAKSSIQKRK